MRLVKYLILVFFFLSLGAIFYVVQKMDNEVVQVNMDDRFAVALQGDTLARQVELDTHQTIPSAVISTLFQDYEARMEGDTMLLIKGNNVLLKESILHRFVRQILLSDLNQNDAPECWVLSENPQKQTRIQVFEYKSGHGIRINFPKLKGSQAMGYAGADTLYFDKTGIVRQFNYLNDPYADFSNGKRACFYQFGKDQSFILKKTLDLE